MLLTLALLAYTSTPIRSYSPPVRTYSAPTRTYSSPSRSSSSTVRPSTPKATPKAWSGSKSYGTGKASKVGKAPLKSSTPPPKAHAFNGQTYNSSSAQYTNTSGMWVWYWLIFTQADGNKQTQCFDKDHHKTTCNRDDKSFQKSW